MRNLIFLILFFLHVNASEIKVAIASNVSYVYDELKEEFYKKHPDIKLIPVFSSSGNLTAQIQNKAPFSIFLSADMKYPQKLYNLALASKPKVYAKGTLALVSVKDANLSGDLSFLLSDKIAKISIANPATAPYGKASVEVLKNAKIYEKLKHKFVYAQSISQSLLYALKVADIGFVASSALVSSKIKQKFASFKIDPKCYDAIEQGVVLIGENANTDTKAFYDFIFSSKAKEIFKKYGYLVDE